MHRSLTVMLFLLVSAGCQSFSEHSNVNATQVRGAEGAACGRGGIAGGTLPPCGENLTCVQQGPSPNAGGICTRVTGAEGAACGSGGIAGGTLPPCGENLTCVQQGPSPNDPGICTRTK